MRAIDVTANPGEGVLPTIVRIGLIPDIGQQGVFDPGGVTDASLVADDGDPSPSFLILRNSAMDPDRETGRGFLFQAKQPDNYETRETHERGMEQDSGASWAANDPFSFGGTAQRFSFRVFCVFRSLNLFGCFRRFRYGFRP